jgi:hypothetical protein
MSGADDLMMRIYAAMAQRERELIGERRRAALAAAKARGVALGGDRGHRPRVPPGAAGAARARQEAAERAAHPGPQTRAAAYAVSASPTAGPSWMGRGGVPSRHHPRVGEAFSLLQAATMSTAAGRAGADRRGGRPRPAVVAGGEGR